MTGQTLYSWFQWINREEAERPDRTTPESEKDEAYHEKCWEYYLGKTNTEFMNWYLANAAINQAFANDQIWGLPEDKEMFLMDEGEPTGRRALKSSLIRPMVTRLVGQLSQASINARASSDTQRARTRKEDAKKMAVLFARAAQQGPEIAMAMQQANGVGPDEGKADQDAEESYQDMLIPPINSLLTMCANDSDFEKLKKLFGERLSISGAAAARAIVRGSKIYWEPLEVDEVFWDTSAKQNDVSDAEYIGCRPLKTVSSLCEEYQPSKDKIKALDELTKKGGQGETAGSWPNLLPRPHTIYWRDQKFVTRGFIDSPEGPILVTIDEINPDTKKPYYTEKDLIDPPENRYTANWTGKTDRRCIEVVRYCTGIPKEYAPSGEGKENVVSKRGNLILEWGLYELQEVDPDQSYAIKFPIKMSAWANTGGYIISPITSAISTQRVKNQVLTELVWRMSKADHPSTVIDKLAITSAGQNEKKVLRNLKEGNPIAVMSSHLGGVNNAIAKTAGGLDRGFFDFFGLLGELQKIAESSTGIYGENFGEPGSDRKLVGVQQLQLQQASVMMQPFLDAIQELFKQMHQFNAQAARQFYIRHPWVLEEMVGTNGMEIIMQSKDMELEQFRVGIELSINDKQVKEGTDAYIMQQYQLQMLDAETAGELLGNSYPEDVNNAIRRYTKQAKQAAIAQQQEQQQALMAEGIAQEEAMLDQSEAELYNQELDAALKVEQIDQKANQPQMQAMSEHLKPEALNPQPAVV